MDVGIAVEAIIAGAVVALAAAQRAGIERGRLTEKRLDELERRQREAWHGQRDADSEPGALRSGGGCGHARPAD